MGKETKLHEAAERGESEELQRLLDTGAYDVNEEDVSKVCEERERERERGVDLLFLSSHLNCGLCAMNGSGYVLWFHVMRYEMFVCMCTLSLCVCTDCVDRLLSIMRQHMAAVSVSVD